MAANPLTAASPTTFDLTLHWASCPFCWGQRRIRDPVPAANGEGDILAASDCPECLGVGEILG